MLRFLKKLKFWHVIPWPNGSKSLGLDLWGVTILIRIKKPTKE